MISIKDLVGFILELEDEFNLLHYEIDGVKVWQYQRHRIFLALAQQVGLYTQAHTKKNNFRELLSAAPSLLYYSVFSNPLLENYQKDILVFSAGRKVKVDGKYIDIYSEYLINKLPENSYEVIEELYLNKHLPANKKNTKHQDFQQVRTTIKSKLNAFKFSESQNQFIEKVESKIRKGLNVEIDLKGLLRNAYLSFKNDFELVKGNEYIRSIYKLTDKPINGKFLKNDFNSIIKYLNKIESLRYFYPFTFVGIKENIIKVTKYFRLL